MKFVILFACFLFIFPSCYAGDKKPNNRRYTNVEYGYSIILPPGLPYSESPAPAPQHGVAITLHSEGRVWIDGSFDAGFLGSAKAALNEIMIDEGADMSLHLKSRKLSGLGTAETRNFKGDKLTLRIVAFRPRKSAVPIIYTLGLDTDRSHANADQRIFRRIERSFTLRTLPN